jgi:outer membrane protein assembly factor BamD
MPRLFRKKSMLPSFRSPIYGTLRRLILLALTPLVLSSCALFQEDSDPTKGWSANKLYTTAKESLDEGNYEQAVKYYEKLEARYPYGTYAQQAQIETGCEKPSERFRVSPWAAAR